MTQSKALELKNICKSFGPVDVIHNVNLAVNEGEFVVFVGPSGCGKSTLLRLIAGLDQPTIGDIMLNGKVVNHVPASQRGLSMVFQSYALYPHMSVRKNLSFGLENLQVEKAEIEKRILDAANLLQIQELMDRRPGQLSGGQRQRVAIGRSIVRKPAIFLFDEPLSNLDAELRLQMRVETSNLHAKLGNTMIYVTHDQIEAMTMADRIVILRDGKIEQIGQPLELYNTPVNKFVAGFIGAPKMNFLQASLQKRTVTAKMGLEFKDEQLPDENMQVTLGIRPEFIKVSLEPNSGQTATIENFEQLGAITYIYCRLISDETLTVQLTGQHRLKSRQTIGITLPEDALHIFADSDNRAINKLPA